MVLEVVVANAGGGGGGGDSVLSMPMGLYRFFFFIHGRLRGATNGK